MKAVPKILVLVALFISCSSAEIEKTPFDFSVAPDVILDTDIGNSVDDLLALDILHHYCRKGKINLLAVMVNHDVPLAPQTTDVFNTWYGAGQTPIGIVTDGVKESHIWEDYAPLLCNCESYKLKIPTILYLWSGFPREVASVRGLAGPVARSSAPLLYRRI